MIIQTPSLTGTLRDQLKAALSSGTPPSPAHPALSTSELAEHIRSLQARHPMPKTVNLNG